MKHPSFFGRLAAVAAAASFALAGVPSQAAKAVEKAPIAAPAADPIPEGVRRAHLAEPLVRTGPTSPAEDDALVQAVASYERRTQPDDLSNLSAFAGAYPRSGWTAGVLTNLGLSYLHDGYFSRAIEAWRGAWRLGKDAKDSRARAMVDRAFGELIRLNAALGQFDQVSALFKEMGKRPITGSATELVQEAREQLTLTTKNGPVHLYNCGPMGLKLLMLARDPKDRRGEFLQWHKVGSNGASLADLDSLATQAKFDHRLIFRAPGQAVPTEGLVHWKVGHYAVIVGKANGRYHLKDPIFPGGELWVTQAALDAEASGYFLVPADQPADAGWRTVTAAEASKVWGRGNVNGTQAGSGGARDPKANGRARDPKANGGANDPRSKPGSRDPSDNGGNCGGMCVYGLRLSTVGVTIDDTPVGYRPALGPNLTFSLTYNQREDSQPANFNFSNVSPKWGLDWLTYITDDPTNPGANVSRYLVGGGAYYYSGYNAGTGQFAADPDDGSVLVRSTSGPVSYQRQMGDGSVEIYSTLDGSASFPRRVFLTQVIDPQGNAVTLSYDGQMRLVSLTDATARQTTLAYENPYWPLLITRITDPFGRSAVMTYDYYGRLSSITDVIGITSSFGYDANSLVNTLTTPYGTTNFSFTGPGTVAPRFVDVTDPMGYHERVEWQEPAPVADSDPAASVPTGMPNGVVNQYLEYRDSFYWDKNAYVLAGCTPTGGCDYSKAVDTHFLHVPNASIKSPTIESVKHPLENRIWYNYPGQSSPIYDGTLGSPIAAGRVLDDGSTQLYRYAYDTSGFANLTQATDPLGRVTTYTYAANHIDLTDVTQLTAGGVQASLAHFVYNTQHRATSVTDAAGQVTLLTYNAAQQLKTVTNALSQVTTYNYNPSGDLTSVVNANNQTAATYTYDAYDRVATFTDSEGWTVGFTYDAADRLTKATYPDGTSETYAYDKLDLASYRDRLGRSWAYAHDANRRLTSITDPAGKQTLFGYNGINELTSRTDANSHATEWAYDLEGRLTTKTYADTSTQTFTYETTTSRLKSVLDALSQTKQYAYAKDNRLTGITYVGAVNPTPNVSVVYDTYFPRPTSRIDGGGTTQFAYVAVGSLGALQLQQETTPLASGTITYAYDKLGRISSRTVQGSAAQALTYDAIGRLATDTNDLGAFTLGYLGQTGQITSRTLASSTLASTWGYLPNSGDRRLASVSTTGLTAGQFSTFLYTSNSENEAVGGIQTSDATINYPAPSLTQTTSYNNLNQLTNLSGQTLTWDADGNLLSDGIRTYSWDAENRLVGISYPSQPGKATAFSYDGLGRRVAVGSTPIGGGSAVTTSYIWCGLTPCQARNAAGSVVRAYYWEGEYTGGTSRYYYAPDRIGSVRRVFASSQAPAYDYDPYGNALQATAALTDYGYAGLFYNVDSGLYLATYRSYDPASGRWSSRDPIGEQGDPDGNLFAYSGGDPVNRNDAAGLWTVQVGVSINVQIGPININGGAGVVADGHGHVGTYNSVGGGAGIGADAGGGVSAAVSNGECIQDVGGWFGNVSVGGGAGAAASVEAFGGPGSQQQPVSGVGVSVGVGGGAEASAGYSNTWVHPVW